MFFRLASVGRTLFLELPLPPSYTYNPTSLTHSLSERSSPPTPPSSSSSSPSAILHQPADHPLRVAAQQPLSTSLSIQRRSPHGGAPGAPDPDAGLVPGSPEALAAIAAAEAAAAADTHRALHVSHGALMAVVFLVIFPLGAVLLRTLPAGRKPGRAHWMLQSGGYVLALVGAGLGLWLGKVEERAVGRTHLLLGMVVLGLLTVQVLLGALGRVGGGQRRVEIQEVEKMEGPGAERGRSDRWMHLWLGRGAVAVGIVDGGLGLVLAGESGRARIAYGVAAGLVGVAFAGLVGWRVHRRHRAASKAQVQVL